MSNRVLIDQTNNTVNTDQCPEIHNSVVVNNQIPSNIDVIENVTNIVTVTVPGPQGAQGLPGSGGAGDISGSNYYVAVFSGSKALVTGSIYDSGSFTAIGATVTPHPEAPERLFVDADDTESYNLISGHGTINNYLQLNIKNFSSGATGSSDIVATADNGDETSFFIDMGVNSSGYNIADGIGQSNDAYLYSTAQDLLIGNASAGKRVIIFNGSGPALDNARVYITSEGTVGVNASDSSLSNPEALLVEPLVSGAAAPNDFNNLIIGRGTINESYLQLNIINKGSGSYASADIVATNDTGTETSNYIDMGINSSNHIVDTTFAPGGPNDSYLLSTANDLLIGSSTSGDVVLWTGADFDDKANAKLTLRPTNQHSLTGSLSATQGFTGSLHGTASWALNTATSSNILGGQNNYIPLWSGSSSLTSSIIYQNGSLLGINNPIPSRTLDLISLQSGSYVTVASFIAPNNNIVGNTTQFYLGAQQALGNSISWTFNYQGNNSVANRMGFEFNGYATPVLSMFRNGNSVFGGAIDNGFKHDVQGTGRYTNNLTVTGSVIATTGFTGSLFGTSSWALNAITASYVPASGVVGLNLSQISSGSVSASVNTDISASFRITSGSNTLLNVTRDGFVWIGNGSFVNQGYQLDINGTTRIAGTLNITLNSGISFDNGSSPFYSNPIKWSNFNGITQQAEINVNYWKVNGSTINFYNSLTGNSDFIIGTSNSRARGQIQVGNVDNSVVNGYFTGFILELGTEFNNNASYQIRSANPTSFPNSYQDIYIYGGVGSGGNYGDLFLQHNTSTKAGNVIIGGNTRVSSSIFSIVSTTQGFLPTRTNLTSNISSPAQGLITYVTASSTEGLWYYSSGSIKAWTRLLNDTGSQSISGSLAVTQAITASNALITNTITAQTLIVQTVTSSIVYSSGSNVFGNALSNTQQFTGSVSITGSLTVNGSSPIFASQTSSMTVASASVATTASYVLNAVSSSYSATASIAVSSSYSLTASYALNAGGAVSAFPFTGSALITGSLGVTGSIAITGSLNVGNTNIEFQENTNVTSGSWRVVSSEPTASYRAAFFDYVMFSGSIARAGTVYSVWSASYAEYYENYTGDVGGSTAGVTLQAAISGSNIQLQATASNNAWTIRSLVRML
jgi:hypothetical protein